MKRRNLVIGCAVAVCLFLIVLVSLLLHFPRPYREAVKESGVSPALVYAVIKAESGFDEQAVSRAGAVGLMQIKPSTAEYICRLEGIGFEESKLSDGEYNIRLGCAYLMYLMEKFTGLETALAAYNAGEGTVLNWLKDSEYSSDGQTLASIPYAETKTYVKKILKFQKIYEILY